ncbi:hypothetical protein DFS33DRAFT_1265431, partial [Desarmillaria ectypa]
LVVVFSTTGKPGGSIVSCLLDNPSYRVRAVRRNPDSEEGKSLAEHGEMSPPVIRII